MKRSKIMFFILLLAVTLSTVLCGCSLLTQDAEEYIAESAIKKVEDALYDGKTKCTVKYTSSSISSADLQADLNEVMDSNYLFSCMLEDISAYAEKGIFYTEVTFKLNYNKNAEGSGAILNVSGEKQLRETLSQIMKTNAAKTPLLIHGYDFSEESFSNLLNESEINCDESAYEYENIYYAFYEKHDDRQLAIVWGEVPVKYTELVEKNAELAINVNYYVQAVKELQPANSIDKYETIYDLLCKTVSYDYDLADASIEAPDNLSAEMLRDRTAYGALITRSTVCSGYSRAFKNICDELNLPCYIVTGYCDGVRHAWNVVPIDGQHLYIDCTSGDEGGYGNALFLFTEREAQYYGYVQDDYCQLPF